MWNWFSDKNKGGLPEVTPLQVQRTKQIEQLKTFNQNVTEIQRDLEYRVNTNINGKLLSLYITLPPLFPQDKPQVKVSTQIQHSWVNELMFVTGSPSLNNFSLHSDLGATVKEVIDEFQRNPPTFMEKDFRSMDRYAPYNLSAMPHHTGSSTNTPAYTGYPQQFGTQNYLAQHQMPTLPASLGDSRSSTYGISASGAGLASALSGSDRIESRINHAPSVGYQPPTATSGPVYDQRPSETVPSLPPLPEYPLPYPTPPSSQNTNSASSYRMPEIPLHFPQLKDFSKEELEAVLENEEKMFEVIQNLPVLIQLQCDREAICKNNEQLANENLSKKPVIEDKKRNILERYDQLNELRSRFAERSAEQAQLRKRYSPKVLQDRLSIAEAQAEEQAEAIADAFVDGKIPLEEFRKNYMEVRTLSHLRKAKEEKLNTALLRLPYS